MELEILSMRQGLNSFVYLIVSLIFGLSRVDIDEIFWNIREYFKSLFSTLYIFYTFGGAGVLSPPCQLWIHTAPTLVEWPFCKWPLRQVEINPLSVNVHPAVQKATTSSKMKIISLFVSVSIIKFNFIKSRFLKQLIKKPLKFYQISNEEDIVIFLSQNALNSEHFLHSFFNINPAVTCSNIETAQLIIRIVRKSWIFHSL